MKVLQFTIPVRHDKTIVTRIDHLQYFYPYLHRHKEMQITWVKQGEGILVTDHNMHGFQKDEVFILGANQPHVFKNTAAYFEPESNKSICSLDIFFDTDIICQRLLNIPELRHLSTFIGQAQRGLRVPWDKVATISAKMEALHDERDGGTKSTILFLSLLEDLAALTEAEVLSSESTAMLKNEDDGIRIGHIYNYILHNFDKAITLEEVARQAYMTPQAFCRFFKKHTRHTFINFLNQIRINEARKQLSSGGFDSISGVAYNCGFNSITSFNRVFKTLMGQSPSAYIGTLNYNICFDEPQMADF